MEFIKTLWSNKKIVWQLGKNDFKNRFAATSLGAIWGFLQPFVFMVTYVIVFQYILKAGGSENYPYAVWFFPGMTIWQWINEAILSASSSIRQYSYLVKKVVFPVDVIPAISIIASSFVGIFLLIIAIAICAIFGFFPNIITLLYVIFASLCFIISITRFTAAVTTVLPDFANLLGIVMQLFFWFTPIIWDLSRLASHPTLLKIVQCSPFSYLILSFREVFGVENIIFAGNGIYTVLFWSITIIMFIWGNSVFKRTKKDFADVL